ncbi:hypothetical protein D9758_005015 [Tetrapyrgos nigripes]|uniref:Cellulose-binding protein n=1 Tax=Tetrapyrgos nigripes TaxID=182062 RepID=A0A8H5GW81_9AGAR|nr:hypothetical protein D9758_005015 [Tetrapyrgos nigripes]
MTQLKSLLWVFAAFFGFSLAVTKPRVFVLTDIANEPDDAMSLTRFLVYSNQFDVQGICATTSVWLQNQTRIDQIQDHITEYDKIYDNLSAHQPDTEGPWPTAEELFAKTYTGLPLYGLEAVGEGKSSNGSIALRTAVEASEEVTWVLLWGGGNVLAQAVWEYEQNHTITEVEHFISKLRVYSISDQDDSSPSLRRRHPQIFWIYSNHAMNVYNTATWTGISGEILYKFDEGGPDSSIVTNDWLQTNIRDVSSFGSTYPEFAFIMEGMVILRLSYTSFKMVWVRGSIRTGAGKSPTQIILPSKVVDLDISRSWGGRYGRVTNQDHLFTDTVDTDVLGVNDANYTSQHVTIWRWRDAYQWDFSARMRWTNTSDFSAVNHNPVVVVNDSKIVSEALHLNVAPGQTLFLDASASYDPDVNGSSTAESIDSKGFANATFWQYLDASSSQRDIDSAPKLRIVQDGLTATVQVPVLDDIPTAWIQGRGANFDDKTLHLVVEVWDQGTPSLVGYKRVVFDVQVPK